MSLNIDVAIPTINGEMTLNLSAGKSTIFLGANGSGKTRLGAFLDYHITGKKKNSQRIAAHRLLSLDDSIAVGNQPEVMRRLSFGDETISNFNYSTPSDQKNAYRWGYKPAVALLDDYKYLLQALYADDAQVAMDYAYSPRTSQELAILPLSKIRRLQEIWQNLLPHRALDISFAKIKIKTDYSSTDLYPASELSDGERVIFYLIGQALVAEPDTVLIFDEPELHINKAILNPLWDEIEAARQDCAFVYITHDTDFATARTGADKYTLRAYHKDQTQNPPRDKWDIAPFASDGTIPDDILTVIIGSRRPILFVEGDKSSLDYKIYRHIYKTHTVIPVGGCADVIHTVASFLKQSSLHHVTCAGLIDDDGRNEAAAAQLASKGISRLPVAEVENLLLLPDVFSALVQSNNFTPEQALQKVNDLRQKINETVRRKIDEIALRYTKRRIDYLLKTMGLDAKTISDLSNNYQSTSSNIDPQEIFDTRKSLIEETLVANDYEKLLLYVDDKELLAEAARLMNYNKNSFVDFTCRTLASDKSQNLHATLCSHLPSLTANPSSP